LALEANTSSIVSTPHPLSLLYLEKIVQNVITLTTATWPFCGVAFEGVGVEEHAESNSTHAARKSRKGVLLTALLEVVEASVSNLDLALMLEGEGGEGIGQ
jgi:hypothetical protein